MFAQDVAYLCCPQCGGTLEVTEVAERAPDREVVDGVLRCPIGSHTYPISNGIPRFVFDRNYNASWDYKWTQIDAGKGLNYKVADKTDPAYEIHDIFDRNSHGGKAHQQARGGLALDLGCGVGQNTWRLLMEYQPSKVVALDLTRGVDIFRQIMLERFPECKARILMVQASVFHMPFRDEIFDYVLSLGVLMHTGNTREAIRQAARVVKYGGHLNVWVYCSEPVPYEAREPNREKKSVLSYLRLGVTYAIVWLWIHAFRRLPHDMVVRIVRAFSSDFWYGLCRTPIVGRFARLLFGTVMHPDRDYRFINNYDGWVNDWCDTWNEHEIFPVLRAADVVVQGISDWRLGFWGVKLKDFYL